MESLPGSPDLVDRIEAHVAQVRSGVRATLAMFLAGSVAGAEAAEMVGEQPVTVDDLDRYAPAWAWLVSSEPTARQQLDGLLAERFGITLNRPQALAHNALDALERAGEYVLVKGGDTLMREGDPSDDFYVVLTGRLAVAQATRDNGEHVIGEIAQGATIGEMGAITGTPRSARVFAVRDSHLLRIPRVKFDGIAARFPEVLRGVILTLIARQRDIDTRKRGPLVRTVAVVALSPDVPLDIFSAGLASALDQHGRCRLVTESEATDLDDTILPGWLNGLEETHRFIVYQAQPTNPAWTALCIRQSDRVFLVGHESRGAIPTADEVERLLGSNGIARAELVLLHPPGGGLPLETRAWLSVSQPMRHHHARIGSAVDLGHLARHLAGRSVGLVLGGGGVRAFAHIGAIRALEEAGVPIDVVGGASAGAIIAAQYAAGWTSADLYARNRGIARRARGLIDYTLPFVAAIQARKFTALLDELFGDIRIEDLWLSFWCLSSNLTRAEKIVHQSGSVAQALRATCALPGIMPPVLIDGDVVVDGGLVDTVPVATMNEILDGGFTVAVDVSAEIDLAHTYSFGQSVSGLQLLWQRLNPFAGPRIVAPSLTAVLLRSIELGSVMTHHGGRQNASLFVKLPVSHVDRLKLDEATFDQLVDIGYTRTRDMLRTWPDAAEVVAPV
jgi:predicted acylesterase/phospholipase RssA